MADPTESRLTRLFLQAQESVFLLNHQRRVIFVNPALEKLLGQTAANLQGLLCRPYRDAEPNTPEAWGGVLAPPAQVLAGTPARIRRLVPSAALIRRWWDIDFLPLRGKTGVAAIIGRILPLSPPPPPTIARLSEDLAVLRHAQWQRHRLDLLPDASRAMGRVINQTRLASQTRVPVLIRGEVGTGKEWLARAIHAQGLNPEGTLVSVDARRLPPAALTEVLVGPVPWLERAGTLYLQEPQCLPRELQQRVVDRLVEPAVGPRILAGCSVDPAGEVAAGRLLGDLHDALATLVIDLPPLRGRLDDLPILVERFLADANANLAGPTWELLRRYPWPGNLDELRLVLANAAGRANDQPIEPAHLSAQVRQAVALDDVPSRSPDRKLPLDQILEQVERRLIQLALQASQGNKTRAAELLAIWRPRLLRRMEALKIADAEEKDIAAE